MTQFVDRSLEDIQVNKMRLSVYAIVVLFSSILTRIQTLKLSLSSMTR